MQAGLVESETTVRQGASASTTAEISKDSFDSATVSRNPLESIESYLRFPKNLSVNKFYALPATTRRELVSRNKVIGTDHYNLAMDRLESQRPINSRGADNDDLLTAKTVANQPGSYTLQLRRSPQPYTVACGLEDAVERLALLRVTQEELDFAKEWYASIGRSHLLNTEMWQSIIDNHDGRLPITVKGVPDGTILKAGEPLARVDGPSELVAHFEHVFHRVFYESMVATKARAIREILGDPRRFIEVGLRSTVTDVQHMDALYAAFVGGGIDFTSSEAGACANKIRSGGTIGHRYLETFVSEEAAFRFAIERSDTRGVTLLIDLVDSMQGLKKAIDLKVEYRDCGKPIGARLDSGTVEDLKNQVRYYLTRTNELGLTDPKRDYLVVEGIDSLEELKEIEEMVIREFGQEARTRVLYGAGGLLVSDGATRTAASSGFKQAAYTNEIGELEPCMKPHRSAKGSYPGMPTMVIKDGRRMIAQEDEILGGVVEQLFRTVYSLSSGLTDRSSPEAARQRTDAMFERFVRPTGEVTQPIQSPETIQKTRKIFEQYGVEAPNLAS